MTVQIAWNFLVLLDVFETQPKVKGWEIISLMMIIMPCGN